MKKAKILIVEDEAIIAMEIESQLRSLGHKVTSIVDTGEKAIEKAEEDKPDLILMDIRIKGEKDGIEAAEEIRHRFGIPVIFSTAYLDEERIERAKITMPFGYVLKPIQERNLRVTIEMAVHVSKVDAERRKAEETYRGIFLNSQVGLFRTDIESGFLIDANDSLARFAGYKNREEFLAQPFSIAERYVDVVAREKMISLLKKNGEVNNHEIRFRRDDDSIIWLRFSAKTIPDKGWMEGVSEDITKEKEIEKALKESEEKFRAVITNSQAVTFIFDENGVFILSEGKGLELLGLKPGQVVGQSAFDVYKEYPKVISGLKKAMKGDTTRDILDVGEVTFDVLFTPIEGKPGYVAGIATDITERVKSEKDLKESEERHRTLFETMAQGVVYQDADGNITDANPAAERILGLSLDQMQGRTSIDPRWKSIHKDGSDFPGETHPAMVALKDGKKVNNVVMGVFHPQREEHRWINIYAIPKFREGESKPYAVYTTFDDITELEKEKE